MAERPELFTNNLHLAQHVTGSCRFVDGSAFDVLVVVRDRLHQEWRLLTHPLCGNLRPHQQPFRSVLIAAPNMGAGGGVCPESLALIEEALGVYRSYEGRWALPGGIAPAVEEDYAYVDAALLQETLTRFGLWTEGRRESSQEGR